MKYKASREWNWKEPVSDLGCMRLAEHDPKRSFPFLKTALEVGINFFDH